MFALGFVVAVALILAVLFLAESLRTRAAKKLRATPRSIARRQPHLEDAIRSAFDGPAAKHGAIFHSYSVWKREHETRLELIAADPFSGLNEFTRCLIVRHLWRALEALSEGAVVVVDSPPQVWSRSINEKFQDRGVDPWRLAPIVSSIGGPQFAKD